MIGEKNKDAYVYFIEAAPSIYKIGASMYPQKRVKNLQRARSYPLRLYALIPSTEKEYMSLEFYIHKRFRGEALIGEWFYLTEEQVRDCLAAYKGYMVK